MIWKHLGRILNSSVSSTNKIFLKDVQSTYRLSSVFSLSKRFINLQEYQSKQLMERHGVKIQKFRIVSELNEIKPIVTDGNPKTLNAEEYVIKAQVLAGGRGKGHFKNSGLKGGVKLTKNKNEIEPIVKSMLGDYLVTAQTTKDGLLVRKVMIAEAIDIKKELYLAILLDRVSGGPIIVASQEGGMDIEQVAEKNSQAVHKFPIPIDQNMKQLDHGLALKISEKGLGLTGKLKEDAAKEIEHLYEMFLKLDALQVEINPFGITNKDEVICFDAKMNFDENAVFRHEWMKQLIEENSTEDDPRDILARQFNLNFVPMDGNIACLVNGAGLAMATMDIIHRYGGSPANFLDVGGSINQKGVESAFKLLMADKKVRAVLVNIFGGIVNCETIAKGLVAAKSQVTVPLVVRLEGTNAEQARNLLLTVPDIITAKNLDDAAQKVVSFSKFD
ncbi:Succinate--CoA ligase [GDP-forming] subunit beta [Sarcoptes scabiei]|uniref:Succinate--CoA ligase [ADP-forming] subunit beta, mitochondrial n=1 Tax=Sarcoptes scabiei TaxID=52283 RepID=A0A132AKH3_SARSC|nr:Succinate--CoA ligase [GDP-forming] subunit beta [Sarcoptes scabiei]KPM11461.1 GTP-specific succinyl-CoA synthetase, beta subunit-like protein [Sarcoptes scabiei]UXI15680.1 kinesin-associated protein 3-like [Sarcoptes scabiei]